MTTPNDVTDEQISALHEEAIKAQDYVQAALCELSLTGKVEHSTWIAMSGETQMRVSGALYSAGGGPPDVAARKVCRGVILAHAARAADRKSR